MTEARLPVVTIYTDGACVPNPGPGGWAAVLISEDLGKRREISGSVLETDNIRMELQAAVEALSALKRPCMVNLYTDSRYLSKGVTEWLPRWKNNNWQLQNGMQVKNQDLWKQLDQLLALHHVEWHWVKAHAENELNERVDFLAHTQVHHAELPPRNSPGYHLFTRAVANKKHGAWGAMLVSDKSIIELSGMQIHATSNQMELLAILEGLNRCPLTARIYIYTHNNYIYSALIRDLELWKLNGWQTTSGQPVQHRELWQRLLDAQEDRTVSWHLVKQETLPESEQALKIARTLIRENSR